MILAAGLGTRLGTIGERSPKALIDVGGRTMLEHAARRLVAAGADRLIVNVHHHADAIRRFIETHDLGAAVTLSHEPRQPLETGGGLIHARSLFRSDAPFLLYNVDVITDADLSAMYRTHVASVALATLAVNERATARALLFDEAGLRGRTDTRNGTLIEVRPAHGTERALAFAGIHVVSPAIFELITERGVFSILEPYLRLAGAGRRIDRYDITGSLWLEIGTQQRLDEARARIAGAGPPIGTVGA